MNTIMAFIVGSSSASIAPPAMPIVDTLKGVDVRIHDLLEAYRASCFQWLLIATGVVLIGVAFEGPELWREITNIVSRWRFKRRFHFSLPETHTPDWMKLFAFAGWLLIVLGIAGEYVADSFVSAADGFVQHFDEIALADAIQKAGSAELSAKLAADAARTATGASGNALTLARDARKEADALQQDIKSAKEQAGSAKSLIAEATKSADILRDKLARLTTPRYLPHSSKVVTPLKAFRGTEYFFSGTCDDQECFDLVENIDDVLDLAGWKRVKGPPLRIGIPQFLMRGDKDFAVDASVSTGVVIFADAVNGWDSIKNLPDDKLPQHIRAAVVLNQTLASNISPPENTGRLVKVDTGISTVVRIEVGRKPM